MIAPTRWLLHLENHLPVARKGADPEGVHQVRVAGRRLRVWLELGGYQVLHDDLRWLVRGAGKVR
ncbi:MAG TPA: CHAD domain-containing protein, partial [Meiothermus sp.]|nr:CHAD domain-containing protein [Meiothermus sp.]